MVNGDRPPRVARVNPPATGGRSDPRRAAVNDLAVVTPALRDQWFVVAESADVTTEPIAVRLLGDDHVLWRDDGGTLRAALDRCPHRDARLSPGEVVGGRLVCPYHGWNFGGDGRCVHVPALGADAAIPPAAALRTWPVVERYGLVWVSPGTPTGRPPEIAAESDPAFRRINTGIEHWSASALRMTDNFCDVAHFPFVHRETLGAEQDPRVASYRVEDLDDDFVGYRYEVDVIGPDGSTVRQAMTTGVALPFTVRSTTHYRSGPDAGADRILMLCATPADAFTTTFTFVVWRSGAGVDDDEQIAFDRAIGAEDRAMLETVPGELPLVSPLVSTRADRLSVEWRRRMAALLGLTERS